MAINIGNKMHNISAAISPPTISRNPPRERHPVQAPRQRRGRRRPGIHASIRLRSPSAVRRTCQRIVARLSGH